jgi:excisionase family DNA binding protein
MEKNNLLTRENGRIETMLGSLDAIVKDVRELAENCRPALNGERCLTDRELSERLSVSRRTLLEWRTEELIGYIQLGGKILYRESDVLKFIEKHFHKPYER